MATFKEHAKRPVFLWGRSKPDGDPRLNPLYDDFQPAIWSNFRASR